MNPAQLVRAYLEENGVETQDWVGKKRGLSIGPEDRFEVGELRVVWEGDIEILVKKNIGATTNFQGQRLKVKSIIKRFNLYDPNSLQDILEFINEDRSHQKQARTTTHDV